MSVFLDFKDEIIDGEPMYNIIDKDGNILNENVYIDLSNQIIEEGTPLNKGTFYNMNNILGYNELNIRKEGNTNYLTTKDGGRNFKNNEIILIEKPALLSLYNLNIQANSITELNDGTFLLQVPYKFKIFDPESMSIMEERNTELSGIFEIKQLDNGNLVIYSGGTFFIYDLYGNLLKSFPITISTTSIANISWCIAGDNQILFTYTLKSDFSPYIIVYDTEGNVLVSAYKLFAGYKDTSDDADSLYYSQARLCKLDNGNVGIIGKHTNSGDNDQLRVAAYFYETKTFSSFQTMNSSYEEYISDWIVKPFKNSDGKFLAYYYYKNYSVQGAWIMQAKDGTLTKIKAVSFPVNTNISTLPAYDGGMFLLNGTDGLRKYTQDWELLYTNSLAPLGNVSTKEGTFFIESNYLKICSTSYLEMHEIEYNYLNGIRIDTIIGSTNAQYYELLYKKDKNMFIAEEVRT